MKHWFDARTRRECWLAVLFLWSAVLLWSQLGFDRFRHRWDEWRIARSAEGLRVDLGHRRETAYAHVRSATKHPVTENEVVAGLAAVAEPWLLVTTGPSVTSGVMRWTLAGQDLPVAVVVDAYRRVNSFGGNVCVEEATLTAAGTEGQVNCRLTVLAWSPPEPP